MNHVISLSTLILKIVKNYNDKSILKNTATIYFCEVCHMNTDILTVRNWNQNWKNMQFDSLSDYSTNCTNYVQRQRTSVYVALKKAWLCSCSRHYHTSLQITDLLPVQVISSFKNPLFGNMYISNWYLLFWSYVRFTFHMSKVKRNHRLVCTSIHVKTNTQAYLLLLMHR
jgi:hypothetical protein